MFKSLQISNALALEDWLRWTDRKKDYWSHGLRHKAEIWSRWSDGLNGLRQNLLDQLHHDRPHSHPHSQPHLSQGFESVPCLLHSRLPSYYYKKSRIDLRKKKTRSMKWSEGVNLLPKKHIVSWIIQQVSRTWSRLKSIIVPKKPNKPISELSDDMKNDEVKNHSNGNLKDTALEKKKGGWFDVRYKHSKSHRVLRYYHSWNHQF